jgi:hypothetical protein
MLEARPHRPEVVEAMMSGWPATDTLRSLISMTFDSPMGLGPWTWLAEDHLLLGPGIARQGRMRRFQERHDLAVEEIGERIGTPPPARWDGSRGSSVMRQAGAWLNSALAAATGTELCCRIRMKSLI